VSYTNKLMIKQMVQYGEGGSPADYEEDHVIPLELGGAPNPRNLWMTYSSGATPSAAAFSLEPLMPLRVKLNRWASESKAHKRMRRNKARPTQTSLGTRLS
jgi:hypothetical protein